jgi:outer membrane protein assembly factor BamE (lipoprotein component of BamABCDE complex)
MAYPYEISEAGKKMFTDRLVKLRVGDKCTKVVTLLGPPFSQEPIAAKEHDKPLGMRVTYYFKKKGDGVNERYDQSVTLDFDNDKRLVRVGLQNLPDLADQLTTVDVTATRWNDNTKAAEVTVRKKSQQ